MASCRAPAQPRQQQQQQPACPPMSFPVSYPYMDAQQLQQFYIAQMLQPQPPIGPNVYVQPWYMCQPPSCQNYGYCYGMQMPPGAMLPPSCSSPPDTPSIQSTGSENSTGNCCGPTTSTRCVPNDRKRSPAGGRTYQQCSVPLPETACGWCGSVNSFQSDGSAQLEPQRFAACSICPAPSPEIQGPVARRRQQQEEEFQNDLKMEQNMASKKEPQIDSKKDQRVDSENESKIDSENEEEIIDSENHSRNASKKEQKKDLKKAQKRSSKEEKHSSQEEKRSSKEEKHSTKAQKHSPKKHHKEDIKPEKPAKPETLKEDIDSALGSSASSFIKRLGVLMRHRSTRSSMKRKQSKARPQVEATPTPSITPVCSNISAESLQQPPTRSSFLRRLFGEVRDNDMAFYAQKSRCNVHYEPKLHSDSLEQLEAFKKLKKKQRLSGKGPYQI